MNYSKPTKELTINDWPYGRKRVKCVFSVESNKDGTKERGVRVTENPRGGMNTPKKLTYAHKVLFVIGDDNKTYVLELTEYGSLTVMQSNFKYQQENLYNEDPRYSELLAMFD